MSDGRGLHWERRRDSVEKSRKIERRQERSQTKETQHKVRIYSVKECKACEWSDVER